MNIEQESILNYTGQAWKYNAGLFVGSISTIAFISAFVFFSSYEWQYGYLIISSGVGAFASLVIEFSIKCPKCKSHWYLEALKKSVGSGSLKKFRTQKTCPSCGLKNETIT